MAQQQSPRLIATILWAALLAGPTLFMAVALYLVLGLRGGAGVAAPLDAGPALLGGSVAISVVTAGLSWRWAVRMRRPAKGGVPRGSGGAIPPGPEADGVQRLVVACGLCEFGALTAVVAFLVTGDPIALAPYALSWLALAAHFPGDRLWAQLTGVAAASPQRPNPMIRG